MQQTDVRGTRRQFLRGAAAGIAFCGCGWPGIATAQPVQPARRPVTVNGKQVKTIDVHSHCLFREATALLGEDASRIGMGGRGGQDLVIDLDTRLKAMDAQAIDLEVLSINPYWYGRDRDLAAKIVQIQNEKLAEFVAAHRDRFAAFASLTLQDPQLAVQESSRPRSSARACAAPRSAERSRAHPSRIPSFIRCGRRPRSSTRFSSSTRRACPSSPRC